MWHSPWPAVVVRHGGLPAWSCVQSPARPLLREIKPDLLRDPKSKIRCPQRTQRIDFFFFWKYDSKNWTLFFQMSQWFEPFFFLITKRIEPFFEQGLKEFDFFTQKLTQRMEPLFKNFTQRIELSCRNMTRRNWTLSKKKGKEWNSFSFKKLLKELNSFEMTHRIEPLFMNLFSIWFKEMKFFSNMTQRLEFFSQNVSKNWSSLSYELLKWIKELNLFFVINMTRFFFQKNPLKDLNPFVELWLKELNFFLNLTQWIELFFQIDWKNGTLFWKNDSNNWTFLIKIIQKYDSKDWTFFNMTLRFWILFKKSNSLLFEYDAKNRSHFFECDSKIEFCLKTVKKLNSFQRIMT